MRGSHRRLSGPTGAALVVALLAACGGGTSGPTSPSGPGGLPTGGPVTDLTKLCDLVGPGDFATVGITGASAPSANSDGPGSAYCVYAGKSAATGGIEFDVFVGDDSASTYETAKGELGAGLGTTFLPGMDQAASTDGVSGRADRPAALIARKGKLVVVLAAPGGTGVSAKLFALAALVVARAAGITG